MLASNLPGRTRATSRVRPISTRLRGGAGKIPGMLRYLTPLVMFAAVTRAESPKTTVELFNGKDLAGWEYVTSPAADIATVCAVKPDGILAVAGKPVGFLATTVSYEDYHLHVEYRWPASAAKNSNGGLLLHIASGPKDRAWPLSFQVQMKTTRMGDLLPMAGGTLAEKLSTPPGAATPILNRMREDTEKPLGEWNSCDIVCRGDVIEVTINGIPQNRVTKCAPAAGKICFQLEGMPYEVRNVRIAPLRAIDPSFQTR